MNATKIRLLSSLAVIAGLLAFGLPALAGGWAIVSVDDVPEQVTVGKPFTIGFRVLQHGTHPMSDVKPYIRFTPAGGIESQVLPAQPEGDAGHFSAVFTLPTAGTWNWEIQTGFWPDTLPMPEVVAVDGSEISGAAPDSSPLILPILAGTAGLIGVAGGLIGLARNKAWAAATIVAGGLICGVSVAVAAPQATASQPARVADLSPEVRGQRLFIAKGCFMCHSHEAVADARQQAGVSEFAIGPNLTNFSAKADYLSQWLHDPASLKPNTLMPNPDLSEAEIQSLTAFINAP